MSEFVAPDNADGIRASLKLLSELNDDEILPIIDPQSNAFANYNNLKKIYLAIKTYVTDIIELENYLIKIQDQNYLIQASANLINLHQTLKNIRKDFFNLNKGDINAEYNFFNELIFKINGQMNPVNNEHLNSIIALRNLFTNLVAVKNFNDGLIDSNKLSKQITDINGFYERAERACINTEALSVLQAGAVQADFFNISAGKYKTASRRWLGAITAILIIICILSFCFSPHLPDIFTTEKYKIIYFFITKFTLICALIYALFFAFKNHNANKHNSILNKHRADSLLTYKAILDVAGKDKQDIILTQISDCMFKHQDTGFGKPDDSGLSSEQMINLFTKLIGKPAEPR